MKIRITEIFDGYPEGKKRSFAIDEEPDDLPDEIKQMYVDKSLAVKLPDDKPVPPSHDIIPTATKSTKSKKA